MSNAVPGMTFDPKALLDERDAGHGVQLGLAYRAHGPDWVELELPYAPMLVGDPETGVIASGPVLALMDLATSLSVWRRLDRFVSHATMDLRVDYLRPARPGFAVIGRGECYRVTRSIGFVRGEAHDGDPADPIAHVTGTFMAAEGYW